MSDFFNFKKKYYDSGTLIKFRGKVKTTDNNIIELDNKILRFLYTDKNCVFLEDTDNGERYVYEDSFNFKWCIVEIVWDKTMYQDVVDQANKGKELSEEGCNNIILGIVLMVFGLVFYDWWLIWIMVVVWLYFSVIKGGK